MAIEKNPKILEKRKQAQKSMDQWMKKYRGDENFRKSMAVVTIPVVVHVLYANSTQNISDAQIQSQIVVLTDDFRKLNSDFNNTPAVFQAVAADVELEFCLATEDPNGNAITGITRKSVSANFNLENSYANSAQGGTPAWDRGKYLNIWVGDLGGGLLGFAYLPGGSPSAAEDGVVIEYRAFGTIETAGTGGFDPFNLGRTATHEVGHFLNLEHIWGGGGCGNDDFVTDTPPQNGESSGCPSFPLTDNCTSGNGIMFQNYMDYSDDVCMSLFTQGQKTRMLAGLNHNTRSGLLTSTGCSGGGGGCDDGLVDCNGTCLPAPCPCDPSDIFISPLNLSITFDNYAVESSWDIKSSNGTILHSANYNAGDNNSTIIVPALNLNDGVDFSFNFYDSFDDGICCGFGSGSYSMKDASGAEIATGGQFTSSVSHLFCIASIDLCSNGIQDTGEDAVDCGGNCPPCVTGCSDTNAHNYDPEVDIVDNSLCLTCIDNTQNGDESGIDCGGKKCGPCDCDSTDYTSSSQYNANTTIYAQNMIVSDHPVNSNVNVLFVAGNSITLNPGFEVAESGIFEARIELCTNMVTYDPKSKSDKN